jgi:hypothetical protein
MKPLIAILIVLFASVATAQPLVLSQRPADGTYVLTIAGPAVTLEKATMLQIGPVPTPVDPVTPVDPTLSPDAQAVKAAADGAAADPSRAETAGNLAEVMGMLKSQVDARTLTTYPQIAAAANWLMDSIIGKQGAAWQPLKDLVGQRLAALGQQGAQPEEYAGYFADAADGLGASIPPLTTEELQAIEDGLLQDPRQRIDIDKLMKLFEFFVKYILPWIM